MLTTARPLRLWRRAEHDLHALFSASVSLSSSCVFSPLTNRRKGDNYLKE